ncbi:MAG: YdiU family protein [Halioglobus sp.]|nr:YdiU family protein [Halioglobus sp.]
MGHISFNNNYARLPKQFYTRQKPIPVRAPGPIRVNRELSLALGIDPDWLASAAGTAVIAGNAVPEGADPIATVYAGHQFGGYNPQLGDGRALLLGEILTADGRRYDLQLKGSGPTPYSRGGDGRSPLGPVLREYILSEAMFRLAVPTTRALAAVTTGERVIREDILPGAVLARVASSHIRIGTFQYFTAQGDHDSLRLLADHVIERHYPDLRETENPILGLLECVVKKQAQLVARWQLLGFIHGVMNTDNVLVSGETIDYGPCAFMDAFNPAQVFSSIDHGGRYAYRNQPGIAQWNLACLANALMPILHSQQEQATALAQQAIDAFPDHFLEANSCGIADKLGLQALSKADVALVEDLWQLMTEYALDFTLTFRRLADLADNTSSDTVAELFEFPQAMQPWLERWRARSTQDTHSAADRQSKMYSANPAFIPRNHLVEKAIVAATEESDFSHFDALVDVLERPHQYHASLQQFATPPRDEEVVRQTFCGT